MPKQRAEEEAITLEIHGNIAVICLQRGSANALNPSCYALLAERLRTANANPNTLITVFTGKGKFLSAGADVKGDFGADQDEQSVRVAFLKRFASGSLDLARELYRHSKILVCAMNGPAVGLTAGILGYFDFIYAQQGSYLLTPFTSLGLIAEGGSSQTFVQKMGLAKATEILILGKRTPVEDLLVCGFVNKVFPRSDHFLDDVLQMLRDDYKHLNSEAVLKMKQIIHAGLPNPDTANLREIYGAIERFESGEPQINFARIASKL